ERVLVLTVDGRSIVGTLIGLDQMINIVLEQCHQRIYSEEGVKEFNLGVHIIRGDDVAIIGEIEKDLDDNLNLKDIHAAPMKPIVH
ncbi:hypothetical protein SAMD00019534_072310, partial [Acytostelium subglobosum LB1]|uniref:hypothetical protein n=1 Tax=Acytostelium subglobosum LB1 TaxID=1410327 RepID=UPI000644CB3D